MIKKLESFGMLELLVAISVFLIIGTVGITTVIFGMNSNRLGAEESHGSAIVQEGIDAVKSIKSADWGNIVDGTYGLRSTAGFWEFFGTEDIDPSNRYTRQIIIESVNRDETGNIVESGGINDPSTKKVTSRVNWAFSPTRNRTVESVVYLTNWEKMLDHNETGMLVYADYSGADDLMKYRFYDRLQGWSEEKYVPDIGVPDNRNTRRVEVYAAPTRSEYILITKHTEDGQFLYAQVWDGSSWGNDAIQLVGYGDNTNPATRNFDGAYLANGNFLIVYDDFTYIPKYRIWNGTSWSAQGSVGSVGGYPVWIDVEASPGTNNAMVTVREYFLGTISMYWNGSSWSSPYEHTGSSSTTSTETISFAWSLANPEIGGLIFNNSYPSDQSPNIRVWQESNSWSGTAQTSVGGNTIIMDMAASPTQTIFLGCAQDTGRDINCLRGNSNATWTTTTNGEISSLTHTGVYKSFDVAFEGTSTSDRALAVYSDGTDALARSTPKYRSYNPSTNSWSSQSSLSALGPSASYELLTVRVEADWQTDDIMVVMGDSDQDISTIVWDGDANSFYSSGDNALMKHGIDGSFDSDYWFSYAWRRYVAP